MKYIITSLLLFLLMQNIKSQLSTFSIEANGKVNIENPDDYSRLYISSDPSLIFFNGHKPKLSMSGRGGVGVLRFFDNEENTSIEISGESSDSPNFYTYGSILINGESFGLNYNNGTSHVDGNFIAPIQLQHKLGRSYWNIGFYDEYSNGTHKTHLGFLKYNIDDSSGPYNKIVSTIDQSGNYYNISDAKQKVSVTALKTSLQKVLSLRPVRYSFKDDDSTEQLGLIAQELKEIVPELVEYIENGNINHYMVNYSGLIPLLTGAVQDQEKLIIENRKLLLQQKKMIQILESEVWSIEK